MTARGAANALTKLTWIFAAGFIGTSITLTVIAARNAAGSSVLDQAPAAAPAEPTTEGTPAVPAPPEGDLLPPPVNTAPSGSAPSN